MPRRRAAARKQDRAEEGRDRSRRGACGPPAARSRAPEPHPADLKSRCPGIAFAPPHAVEGAQENREESGCQQVKYSETNSLGMLQSVPGRSGPVQSAQDMSEKKFAAGPIPGLRPAARTRHGFGSGIAVVESRESCRDRNFPRPRIGPRSPVHNPGAFDRESSGPGISHTSVSGTQPFAVSALQRVIRRGHSTPIAALTR